MSTELARNRSALNEMLLRNARKSHAEIAELTGLPKEVVAEKLAELLEDRGWYTERQEERLLLEEIYDVVSHARQMLDRAAEKDDVQNYGAVATAVLKGLQLVSQRLDSRKKVIDEDLTKISRAQAREFSEVLDIALTHVRGTLKDMYPLVTDETIDDLAREGLEKAKKELDARV